MSTRACPAFDPDAPYRLSPSVAVRPEPFGAMTYDFHTRKLTFLKNRALVDVVRALEHHPDARSALDAAGVAPRDRSRYLGALAGMLDAGTIRLRTGDGG